MSEDTVHMITEYYPNEEKWKEDENKEGKIMNCFMCKESLEEKK